MKQSESQQIPDLRLHCIDAIEVSLCIEKQGLLYYETAARKVTHPGVKEIFLKLAAEEKEHIQSLQKKAGFLQPALKAKAPSRKVVDQVIAEWIKGKVFPDPEKGGFSRIKNDLEALEVGVESEKRSIAVLNQLLLLENKLDVRMIFSHLLAEEKKHLAALEALKRTLQDNTA